MRRSWLAVVSGVVICVGACNTGPEFSRILGTIQHRDEPVEFAAPSRWAAGAEFTVLVTTYGGCRMAKGDTDVLVEGLRVTVIPYDLVEINHPQSNCPSFETVWRHTARVTVDEHGLATVVFRGLRSADGDTVEVEHTVELF